MSKRKTGSRPVSGPKKKSNTIVIKPLKLRSFNIPKGGAHNTKTNDLRTGNNRKPKHKGKRGW